MFSFIIPHSSFITFLCPFERALAPGVVVADDEDADEDEHFEEREFGEREVVAHEDDGPGEEEYGLHVEDEEEHGDDVEAYGETVVRLCRRAYAALVGPRLRLAVEVRSDEATEHDRKDGEDDRDGEEDHHRPVAAHGPADARRAARSRQGCARLQ